MINDPKKQLGAIGRLALDGDLLEALEALKALASGLSNWEIARSAEKLLDDYNAMLRFFTQGVVDPHVEVLIDNIMVETLALAMRISRQLSLPTSPEIYYSTARTVAFNRDETITSIATKYLDEIKALDNDFDSITDPNRTQKAESILRDLFNYIWVTHPLNRDDFETIDKLMEQNLPFHVRASVVSAVGLGHLSYYDSTRLAWLLQVYVKYAETDDNIALRA